MKIELELEIQEAVVLLNILKQATSREANPNVQNTLRGIIKEIERDAPSWHFILNVIKDEFRKSHLTTSEIYPESNMEWGLGISRDFLKEEDGLTRMAYDILLILVKKFKPETNLSGVKKISNGDIKKCVTVYDLMTLIEKSYETV